jgi:hypothetical protein
VFFYIEPIYAQPTAYISPSVLWETGGFHGIKPGSEEQEQQGMPATIFLRTQHRLLQAIKQGPIIPLTHGRTINPSRSFDAATLSFEPPPNPLILGLLKLSQPYDSEATLCNPLRPHTPESASNANRYRHLERIRRG